MVKTIRYPIDRFDKRLQDTFVNSILFVVVLHVLALFLERVIPGLGGRRLNVRDLTIMVVRPLITGLYIIELMYSFYALYVAAYGICIRKGLNFRMR